MKKQQRKDLAKAFADELKEKSVIFVDYEGIDMPGFDTLRSELRDAGAKIKVFKNTLLKVSLKSAQENITEEAYAPECFSGMTAVAYADDANFSASGKCLLDAENKKAIQLKGGIYEGAFLDANSVRAYGRLPSKDQLYGMLVGVLSATLNNLAGVLEQVAKKKRSEESEQKEQK